MLDGIRPITSAVGSDSSGVVELFGNARLWDKQSCVTMDTVHSDSCTRASRVLLCVTWILAVMALGHLVR